MSSIVRPPVAKQVPHVTEVHGVRLEDPYFWLREKENPEVIAHLEAENRYVDSVMAPARDVQDKIFEELKGRIPPDDASVPERIDDWYYYARDVAGQQYKIYCRKHRTLEADEEILLDLNLLAKNEEYLALGAFDVSPDHRILAYSIDTDGSEHNTIRFKDLTTGQLLPDEIHDAGTSLDWAEDNLHVFYNVLDAQDRPDRVLRHRLGTDPVTDAVVFQEKDPRYFVDSTKTRSRKYLLIQTAGKTSTEVHFLASDRPQEVFRVVEPRREGVEYSVDHHGESFLIVTNDQGAVNFRLVAAPVASPGRTSWKEIIAHDPQRLIEGVEPFRNHVVLVTRELGLPRFRVLDPKTWTGPLIEFPEPTFSVHGGGNPEFNTDQFRFVYTSLTTPRSVYDYDLLKGTRELKKQVRIPGGYDPSLYVSRRIFGKAADGTEVPIALVHRRDTVIDGTAPLLLYGYGSYGLSMDAGFSSSRISLLDRGFVFAIAQIRGGSELGRPWYEDGKFLKKKNTFTDFIACAETLVAQGFGARGKVAIQGGSAGGMLMGAVINLRPELFNAVIAQVPFVDVINTMLDETLPLTPTEYEEWGDPRDRTYFDYMLSYSPYDNIEAKAYPHLLITAGLNDPRVTYWEPAKWCAKLRATRTDSNLLMLRTEMGAGHGGATGRYDSLKEVALIYTFLLQVFGKLGAG